MRFILLVLSAVAATTTLDGCHAPNSEPFKFFFVTGAVARPGESGSFAAPCFDKVDVSVTETESDFEVRLTTSNKTGLLCAVIFFVSTGKTTENVFRMMTGTSILHFHKRDLSPNEVQHVRRTGISVLKQCTDLWKVPKSIFRTFLMFFGGLGLNPRIPIFGSKVPEYMLKENIRFIKNYAGYEWKRRADPSRVHLDKRQVKSGDFIAITRFDGIDQIIQLGSGSRIGHSTMALWEGDELYVIESQEALYWPTHGIQRTKWEDWLHAADNADFNVILVPLNDKYRALFDEKKAWEFFNRMKGYNYGFHNFFFGFIDVVGQNLPEMMDMIFFSLFIKMVDKISHVVAESMIYEALNFRLGTKGLRMNEIWEETYARNISLEQLFTIPEQDKWIYSDGPSYVCSSFLVAVYRAAGLFGDLEINATEFTPKDLIDLEFWDVSGQKVPAGCEGKAPHGYCQLFGVMDMDMGKISFVEPYAHMNERCPSMAPFYNRISNC